MEQQPKGDILDAVQSGDIATVKKFLNEGVPVDLTDEEGWSLLHHAAAVGQVDVINLLHEKRCHVDLMDNEGRTPLHYAATNGDIETIRILTAMDSNVNSVDNEGNTPLKWSVMCEQNAAMEELTRHGGTVEIEEMEPSADTLNTPVKQATKSSDLHITTEGGGKCSPYDTKQLYEDVFEAARCGDTATIQSFLNSGGPVDLTDEDGRTLLHCAAGEGQIKVVELLIKRGCCIHPLDRNGWTPSIYATACGHVQTVQLIKQQFNEPHEKQYSIYSVDNHGRSVLHFAAQYGLLHMIELLAEQGLNVNLDDDEGWTPLHYAATHGQLESVRTLLRLGGRESMTKVAGIYGTPLHQAVAGGHKDIVSLLLNEGCPIIVVNTKGKSVLLFAAECGQIHMIELLAEQGLNVNLGDDEGWTPLHYAAAFGQLELVLTLLRLGGRESMTKVAGADGTPLHQAVAGGHKDTVSLLLNEGCPINVVGSALHCAARFGQTHMIEILAKQGLYVNLDDDEGQTPLHYAATHGQLESVRTLLKLGGRESMTKVAGIYGTPLHQAVAGGHKDIVSLLLDEGCPINVVNIEGKSVLHIAAQGCQIDMIDMLAEQGLDVNIGDDEGRTPLHYAAERGHITTFNELVSIGGNVHHMDNFGMKCSDYILIRQNFVTVIQFCVACGLECDDEGLLGVISALSAKGLLDMNRILCLAAVFGDVSIFDAMVTSQYPLNQQKMPNIAIRLSSISGGKKLPDQFHISEEPLNPLHISILSEYFSILWNIKFIEKLTSHPRTQYTVNELFPNGLSPLDVARRFELHDIAVIIERAGGGPGAWADLPKEIEDKAIDIITSLKELRGRELGEDVTARIVSMLGYPLVISDRQEVNKILKEKPKHSLMDKHVLSSLMYKRKWERIGNLLEVDRDILMKIGEESTDDDDAYYSMLDYWLEHGCNVSWKTLLDAVGHFETKKTVDDITDKIVEELAPLQVSIQIRFSISRCEHV